MTAVAEFPADGKGYAGTVGRVTEGGVGTAGTAGTVSISKFGNGTTVGTVGNVIAATAFAPSSMITSTTVA